MDSSGSCEYYLTECNIDYEIRVQNKLDAPMPWIGLYVAAASAICTMAMAADALTGFRSRRLWFPCKYFSLNAFSLTALAVTMKLPIDLTSITLGVDDKHARVSSLVLMSTAMANFTTSLGSMTNNEIILNLAALAILVITISGNVITHIVQMSSFANVRDILAEEIGSIFVMLLLLLVLCFSAVMVPTAKRNIDLAYREMHRKVSNNNQVEWGNYGVDELGVAVRRYWVMSETGSSQFVMARSVTCVSSGSICLVMGLTLLEAHIRMPFMYQGLNAMTSNYKWSIKVILVVQSIGVALGTIAPLMRWFIAAQFKSSQMGRKSLKHELKVESYWTQRLVQWRDRSVPLQIGRHISRKLLHDAKGSLLNSCIRVQVVMVVASKLVLLFSAFCVKGLLFCFNHIKNISALCYNFKESADVESRPGTELDYSGYVLLLEGESELPQRTLRTICNEVDKLIQMGRKKQPKNLLKLLKKSTNFNGVKEFDTNEVPRLEYSQEPPNCWSLPVVTLTSIAISLPNIADGNKRNQLLRAVSEGLYFAKLIEKTLDRDGDLTTIRHAADVVWVGVRFSKKWQDKDLHNATLKGGSHKETLRNLSDIADKIVKDFTTETKDPLMQNPLNWPVKVIAARSMYRVTETILLTHKDDDGLTDEELFERLSIMISEIFAACLTNLVSVVIFKCHSNAIEEREESIRRAAIRLGESEEILGTLETRELPSLDPKKAASIEEWRAIMELNPPASIPASSN